MKPLPDAGRRFLPRTLLVRTFLLVSLLIFVSVAAWLTLFTLAEREPRARQLAQLTVSVVNLTRAALVAANPDKRLALLRELAEREGVQIYPAEADDLVQGLPETPFFRIMRVTAEEQLGTKSRFAAMVNGQQGLWASFPIDDEGDDEYWVMLPGERAESDFPWHWLGWGGVSLTLALLVAWLIVSRVTRPLRALALAASEVGRGRHPDPLPERGSIELQQLAEAFNRMSEDLRHIAAERAEVLAGISHDLRTPLARLRLEAEMSIPDQDARNAVSSDIEQMDSIIAQFLDYARGEGSETAVFANAGEIIAQTVAAACRSFPGLQVGDSKLPLSLLYPKALGRALANLLENARKYGAGDIAVDSRCEGNEIFIDVLDRGPGIPESETERLKRPFTRFEHARTNASGTGLGLAIVERIARLHGGRLELLARDGGGLIARLRLPVRRHAGKA